MIVQKEVAAAAAKIRASAEDNLNTLAKIMQVDGETFEKAYSRAVDTEMGQSLIKTLDDSTALQTGGVTSMDIADARERLA